MWSFICCSFAVFYRVIYNYYATQINVVYQLCQESISSKALHLSIYSYLNHYLVTELRSYLDWWSSSDSVDTRVAWYVSTATDIPRSFCYFMNPFFLSWAQAYSSSTLLFRAPTALTWRKFEIDPLTYVHMSLHLVFVGRQGCGSRSSTCCVWCV
jgi:hypothetical protein